MKIFTATLLFISSFSFSQQTIKGNVIDAEENLALSYVNIGILNKNTGTVSGKNGSFKLRLSDAVKKEDKIIFSHIGYVPQTYAIAYFLKNKKNHWFNPISSKAR